MKNTKKNHFDIDSDLTRSFSSSQTQQKRSLLEEILEKKKLELETGINFDDDEYENPLASSVTKELPKANHDLSWVDAIEVKDIEPIEPHQINPRKIKRDGELDIRQIEEVLILKDKSISLYNAGNFVESLAQIEKAIRLLPGDLELLYQQALCLYRLGNYSRAEKIFKELYRLDDSVALPALPKVYAFLLLKIKKYDEAENLVKTLVERSGKDMQYLNMLGYIYERQNKNEAGVEIFERIVKYDPFNANACNSLAYCFYKLNIKTDEALDLCKRALKKEPDNPSYLDTFAVLCMRKGNIPLAQKTLRKAVALSPNNEDIVAHLSQALKSN